MQTTGTSKTRKLIAAGAIVALALLSLQAYTMVAGGLLNSAVVHNANGATDPTSNSTVTVTGTGQVEIQPTMALLDIGVNTRAPTAQGAAQQNANTMASVVAALEKLGINSSEIRTISYNIYQQDYPLPIDQQSICDSKNNTAMCVPIAGSYEVDNEIQVTVAVSSQALTTLGERVGAVIDAAVGAGANQMYGVQFTASGTASQKADQQALQLAVQDASGQAKVIASALGVSITGVISVTTSPGYAQGPILYAGATSAQTPIIAPQSLTVSASVQVVYAIS